MRPRWPGRSTAGCDAIVHLATVPGGAAESDPALAWRVNVDATRTLFDAAARASTPIRLVFASSIAVFGDHLPTPLDEDTPVAPSMLYGAHKAMMETWLATLGRRGVAAWHGAAPVRHRRAPRASVGHEVGIPQRAVPRLAAQARHRHARFARCDDAADVGRSGRAQSRARRGKQRSLAASRCPRRLCGCPTWRTRSRGRRAPTQAWSAGARRLRSRRDSGACPAC